MLELNSFFEDLFKRYQYRLNPFCWSKRTIKVITVTFFLIFLPIYIFIGVSPALSIDYSEYATLTIPEINLTTPVASLKLEDHQLIAPVTIAGSYSQNINKTLLIGHSSTVFQDLDQLNPGSYLSYDGQTYQIRSAVTVAKADISMADILASSNVQTIIIMTCAGDPLPNQDATHRLIITATLVDDDQILANSR